MHLFHLLLDLPAAVMHLGIPLYAIAFIVTFLESLLFAGVFVPADTSLVLMGFFLARGIHHGDFALIALCAGAGAVTASTLSYAIGRFSSIALAHDLLGHRAHELLNRGEGFFKQYGSLSVFFSRFLNVLRPFVPFIAGCSRMSPHAFLLWNTIGSFIWTSLFLSLGFFGGHAVRAVAFWSAHAPVLVTIFLLLLILIALFGRSKPAGEL